MSQKIFSVEEYLLKEDVIQDQIDDLILFLIRERKKKKITQVELSKVSGIPQATISRLETFSSIPTLPILLKWSKSLGLSIQLHKKEEKH